MILHRALFSCSQYRSLRSWSALYTAVMWRKRGGKWTPGDHFRIPRLMTNAHLECVAGGHAPRPYRSYFRRSSQLRVDAQPLGPAIGRRVLPPEVAGLLSQWGRERPPSVSAFGVPAPSRGSLTPCNLCPLRPANPSGRSREDPGLTECGVRAKQVTMLRSANANDVWANFSRMVELGALVHWPR